MIACVGVGRVGRDDVANPSQQSARAYPETRRDDQPQDSGEEATIVELSDSRDDPA
jgi:hypothetical protein